MHAIVIKILIIAGIEFLLFLLFLLLGMYRGHSFKNNFRSFLKGWVERSFICFALLNELAIIIAFFGALKLGTRLQDDNPGKISNDQFLMGNIFSVAASIAYFSILSGRW